MAELVAQASIVIVPVAASRYVRGREAQARTHAVRLTATGGFASVVCRRVKLESLLRDWALIDRGPLTCPACRRGLGLEPLV